MSPSPEDIGIEEWKAVRSFFEKYDERLYDLRKYGFSFLIALIAGDSLTTLLKDSIDDRVRLGVIGVTLLLTVALRLFDKQYELFEDAAGIRGEILERRLNLELTETITDRSRSDSFASYLLWLYWSFAGATGLVGVMLLYQNPPMLAAVVVLTAIAFVVILRIHKIEPNLERQVDWSFDRLVCEKGGRIRLILTNLSTNPVSFGDGEPVWEVWTEGEWPDQSKHSAYDAKAGEKFVIAKDNNYIWELKTDKLAKGIYRIFPYHVKEYRQAYKALLEKRERKLPEEKRTKFDPSKPLRWAQPLGRAIEILEPKPTDESSQPPRRTAGQTT